MGELGFWGIVGIWGDAGFEIWETGCS